MGTYLKPKVIRGHIYTAGLTPEALAKKLGVSESAISQTIHGLLKSPRIRQAIADAIGKPVEEIWPS